MTKGTNGMRTVRRGIALAALAVAMSACGDAVRNGSGPAYVVIDTLQAAQGNHIATLGSGLSSDVQVLVTVPAPQCTPASPCPTIFNDVGSASLRLVMKDHLLTPTTNNEVTITRYHVAYRRADGRNRPGVDVPYGFDGASTGTIQNTLTLGFELVRLVAKQESPLVQLITSPSVITVIADVTFYGTDRVGNAVSVTGSITIDFANFGDT